MHKQHCTSNCEYKLDQTFFSALTIYIKSRFREILQNRQAAEYCWWVVKVNPVSFPIMYVIYTVIVLEMKHARTSPDFWPFIAKWKCLKFRAVDCQAYYTISNIGAVYIICLHATLAQTACYLLRSAMSLAFKDCAYFPLFQIKHIKAHFVYTYWETWGLSDEETTSGIVSR